MYFRSFEGGVKCKGPAVLSFDLTSMYVHPRFLLRWHYPRLNFMQSSTQVMRCGRRFRSAFEAQEVCQNVELASNGLEDCLYFPYFKETVINDLETVRLALFVQTTLHKQIGYTHTRLETDT